MKTPEREFDTPLDAIRWVVEETNNTIWGNRTMGKNKIRIDARGKVYHLECLKTDKWVWCPLYREDDE